MLLNIWNSCNSTDSENTKMSTMVENPPPELITTIEWSMMDKSKFFPLYSLCGFTGIYNNNVEVIFDTTTQPLLFLSHLPLSLSISQGWPRICNSICRCPWVTSPLTIRWTVFSFVTLYKICIFLQVRCALYPLTLIKTQIQVQRKKDAYKGVYDAISKIYAYEGVSGLYRGFWLSNFQIISGVFYISTYEGVRHELGRYEISPRVKSFIAGGCASLVGQTVIVPFDVLSQHLMVLGLVKGSAANSNNPRLNPLGLELSRAQSRWSLARAVAGRVYRLHGARGYYRGYAASLAAYVPNSALWWALYTAYQDELFKISPSWVSHLFIQCVAGTLGGFTTTVLTNPLDIVRARLQVEGVGTMKEVFKELWREEGLVGLYAKGLSARLVQSACFSFSIILGYEVIKRVSLSDEYRTRVRW